VRMPDRRERAHAIAPATFRLPGRFRPDAKAHATPCGQIDPASLTPPSVSIGKRTPSIAVHASRSCTGHATTTRRNPARAAVRIPAVFPRHARSRADDGPEGSAETSYTIPAGCCVFSLLASRTAPRSS
jgi:hypothetical protein